MANIKWLRSLAHLQGIWHRLEMQVSEFFGAEKKNVAYFHPHKNVITAKLMNK